MRGRDAEAEGHGLGAALCARSRAAYLHCIIAVAAPNEYRLGGGGVMRRYYFFPTDIPCF